MKIITDNIVAIVITIAINFIRLWRRHNNISINFWTEHFHLKVALLKWHLFIFRSGGAWKGGRGWMGFVYTCLAACQGSQFYTVTRMAKRSRKAVNENKRLNAQFTAEGGVLEHERGGERKLQASVFFITFIIVSIHPSLHPS